MPTRTIRLKLPQDEADMLSRLAQRWKVSMSDIVRYGLKRVFERNFPENESTVLSIHDFQLLADEMRKAPTEDVLERHRHLQDFALWE